MPDFPPAVQVLLARQDNVITRAQLLEHGMTYPTIRWNAGRGWRVILPHVFGIFREPPSPRQRRSPPSCGPARTRSSPARQRPDCTA
jgi:hypothetical protein